MEERTNVLFSKNNLNALSIPTLFNLVLYLATEFAVPDAFASYFVKELYQHILAQKPVGEALLATRRFFWERQCNPLGLAYALYSPLAIQIVQE